MASADKINDLHGRLKQRTLQDRSQFERLWWRNSLFQLGIQRIAWGSSARRWTLDTSMAGWAAKAYTITNKFAAVGATMVQMLVSKPPATRVIPGTDSPEDVAVAQIADRNLDVIYDEARADEARKALANWMVYCGGGFLHPCWDPHTRDTVFVQDEMCSTCQPPKVMGPGEAPDGACPTCGSPMMPAQKPDGQPIGSTEPAGKIKFEVYSPFEVYYDLESRSMDEVDELFIRRRYPITRIRDMYGSDIEPDSQGETGLGITLLRSLAYAAGQGVTYLGGAAVNDQTVTVDYVWKRPCQEYPEGLVGVFVGNQIRNEGETDIPYENKATGKKLWPWYYVPFDRVPGRMTGRTPLDDVAPLQVQRNRLESLIMLITMRSAAPGWLVPRGLGITQLTGEPGQVVDYDSWEGKAKPEQFSGQNVPTSLIARLEKIDADIDQLAGVYDVLRGNAPTGISAGTALRLLLERAVTRFTPALNNLEQAWEPATVDALCIFQQYATEDRVKKIQGPGHTWEIQRFNGASLAGNLDVKVDAGSAIPKNTVGTQSVIQDLLQGMVINPQDPETQLAILEEFGQTKLLGSADLNVNQARREAYNFFVDQRHVPPIVDPVIDNHQVHIMEHKAAALNSDFMYFEEPVKMAWRMHIMDHEKALAPPMPTGPEGPPGKEKGAKANGSAGPPQPGGNQGMPGLPPSSMPEEDTAMPPSPGIQ